MATATGMKKELLRRKNPRQALRTRPVTGDSAEADGSCRAAFAATFKAVSMYAASHRNRHSKLHEVVNEDGSLQVYHRREDQELGSQECDLHDTARIGNAQPSAQMALLLSCRDVCAAKSRPRLTLSNRRTAGCAARNLRCQVTRRTLDGCTAVTAGMMADAPDGRSNTACPLSRTGEAQIFGACLAAPRQ